MVHSLILVFLFMVVSIPYLGEIKTKLNVNGRREFPLNVFGNLPSMTI